MAKISAEEQAAIVAGYAESERVALAYGKARYQNPHLWSSRLWEAFEFGYYLHEMARGAPNANWERKRGNIYANAEGFAHKLHYGKAKGSFGIVSAY